MDIASDQGTLVEEAEAEMEGGGEGVWDVRLSWEYVWWSAVALLGLVRLDAGDSLADVVWPVVGMADGIGWEWLGALLGCAIGG